MSQEVGIEQVFEAIEDAFRGNNIEQVEGLLWPALDQFPDIGRLWFYAGCVFFKKGYCAISANAFEKAIALDDSPHIYSNLGACYRRMNRNDEGLRILEQALDRSPDYAPALVNVGSLYVNEGCPEKGIPYLEKAVMIGGERGAVWNLGLLYLESCRFGEGFDCYREGVNHERAVRSYGHAETNLPEPKLLTEADWKEVVDSGRKPRIILWAEQGIGDEIMFSTVLADAHQHFDIVYECHPRLEKLHRNSTWYANARNEGRPITLYPTRKDDMIGWPINDRVEAEFKAPIGDLCCYYRRDLAAFKDAWRRLGPQYRANPSEVARYREALESFANGRPIVGLATRGGVMQTSRHYRTMRVGAEIDRLMKETDAVFVALDYDNMLPLATYISEHFGEDRYRWFPAIVQHWDYDHTAALIDACDLTVTVCQSAFHMSAAMGRDTRVLTPTKCAWRYAPVPGEPILSYWYPDENVRLYRQDEPESWQHPLDLVIADINALRVTQEEAA